MTTQQSERELWCVYCGGDTFKESSDELMYHIDKGHILTEHKPNQKINPEIEPTLNMLIQYYSVAQNLRFDNEERIENVVKILKQFFHFVTLRNSEKILLYNGKIYDSLNSESIIKEETEKLIPLCPERDTIEVINKIKRQTYVDFEEFDSDPNLITIENGILDLETLKLKPHTPKHLSQVLIPVKYNKPKSENIEDNLKDTIFWKYLKSSFTINEKFRKDDFETILEIIASPIVKRHIDEKAFMFLGNGENGKSVCLSYIESLLGKNNVTHIPLQKIASDKYMSADLDGKSANIFSGS